MTTLTPARIFGLGVSVLAWIAGSAAYGGWIGFAISVVAYPVGIAAYGLAKFGGTRVGDAIAARRERGRPQ